MELQIQDLVSSIKKDGIESANREAAQILADAKAQAEKIVADARSEADKLRADAQAEIGVFKASAQLSAEQAKRDAVLAFRQEIGAELTKLLAQDTHKALDDKALASLITAALQGEDASAYAAEVASVTDALKSELAGELKAGLELRLSKRSARASACAPRTARAISTAPTRSWRSSSPPSSASCAFKEGRSWLPITT